MRTVQLLGLKEKLTPFHLTPNPILASLLKFWNLFTCSKLFQLPNLPPIILSRLEYFSFLAAFKTDLTSSVMPELAKADF